MRQMSEWAVREALRVGQVALPAYGSRTSRKDCTQPQLFALLVLRQFLRTDHRGVVTLVGEWSEVWQALGLSKVPHYSTLAYASRRNFSDGPKKGLSTLFKPASSHEPAPMV